MKQETDLPSAIREVLRRELNQDARASQKLYGGRNSQVFRVECADGSVLAVKAYFQSDQDRRDRLGTEWRALRFLHSERVRQIPVPLAADESRRVAVYEFVSGGSLSPGEIGNAEIDQAVEFLSVLKTIADSGRAAHLPAASEARFSIAAIQQNIDDRLRRLDEAAAHQPALAGFLRDELTPFRQLAGRRCRDVCRQQGISPDAEIPWPERTLSPSDFGFHNALRGRDGRLVFLDFEYFGWDDPAKTVADFLLHPGMQLPLALKRRFFSAITTAFSGVPKIQHRVRAVFPLFAMKWCAILLNEFTLEDRARRCFADGAPGAWNETVQLEKARRLLALATNDDHDFPGGT